MLALSFRDATLGDIAQITILINTAYRGETSRQGWTTEADILDGLRTSEQEIQQLIQANDSKIIVCLHGDELIGSLYLHKMNETANIGLFVVKPSLQNLNIGKKLLAFAESRAKQQWKISKYAMLVITVRHELIAYYERRGYKHTGLLQEFPINPKVWTPKLQGLQLERLEKHI